MKRTVCMTLMILILALQPLAVVAEGANRKSPVPPSAWSQVDVSTAIHAGLVPESLQSQYTQSTTRAEFCTLAVMLYEKAAGAAIGADIIEGVTFVDTDDSNVRKMAAVKVVSGVGDGKFDPNGKLTREQAATVLAQLAAALDQAFPGQVPTFADNAAISAWAQSAVGQVQAAGIMGGVGNNVFSPQGAYTREQSIVTMLYLFHWVVPGCSATSPMAQGQLYPMSALVDGQYLWGYVDKDGTFVIRPQYVYASEWNGEYAIVSYPETPERCSVIDRAETPVVFAYGDREKKDSFALAFVDGAPSVFFAGNCVIAEAPEMSVDRGEWPIYSLTDREAVFSIEFYVFSDGMICGRGRADWTRVYDADGRRQINDFGLFGAFYEGVAMSWGRLYDKQGKLLSDVDLQAREDIKLVPFWDNIGVGDSCVFAPAEWSADGSLSPLRGDSAGGIHLCAPDGVQANRDRQTGRDLSPA